MKHPINNLDIYEHEFINRLELELLNEFNDLEGSIKRYKRKEYKKGYEIDSFRLRIVLHINDGTWFKKSISYDLYTDEFIDYCSLRFKFEEDTKLFNIENLNLLSKYIKDDIRRRIINREWR